MSNHDAENFFTQPDRNTITILEDQRLGEQTYNHCKIMQRPRFMKSSFKFNKKNLNLIFKTNPPAEHQHCRRCNLPTRLEEKCCNTCRTRERSEKAASIDNKRLNYSIKWTAAMTNAWLFCHSITTLKLISTALHSKYKSSKSLKKFPRQCNFKLNLAQLSMYIQYVSSGNAMSLTINALK